MSNALDLNKLSTLSAVLLSNLDEGIFFSQISSFMQDLFEGQNVQVFETFQSGATLLRSENGQLLENQKICKKGIGLAGYVARTKRAYYSNSKRDPLLATVTRGKEIETELCVPVNSNGTIIATINIQSKDADRKFSEEDSQLILEALKQIESAVNNMRLYLIAKNLNRELEMKIMQKEEELENRGPAMKASAGRTLKDIELIGRSKVFTEIMTTVNKIAKEDFPVLLTGLSGTGKKSIAKKLHTQSTRADRACSIVHCAAIAEGQLELELFGTKDKPGVIERTNGGTLILESVDKLPLNIQSKLLRLMVSGELFVTDSNLPTAVNVRIVSICKRNLESLVEEGQFQEELLYRLNIMSITMPGLKERREDIKLLAENFINAGRTGTDAKVITSQAIDKLTAYSWPGNIHELKNLMERTSILVSEQFIDEAHLPELAVEEIVEEVVIEDFSEMTLHDIEKMHIVKTLGHLGGNKTRAAKSLGITVKTLYNKLHSYGLVHPKSE